MSAFVVNPHHINALLNWAQVHMRDCKIRWTDDATCARYPQMDGPRPLSFSREDDLAIMAQILTDQNYRSVNHRYPDQTAEPQKAGYRAMSTGYSAAQIIKACACYDYQASETPDYPETMAHKIIGWIRDAAIGSLPGYAEAAWEIKPA